MPLLVFTAIGNFAWLSIASDGWLFLVLFAWFAHFLREKLEDFADTLERFEWIYILLRSLHEGMQRLLHIPSPPRIVGSSLYDWCLNSAPSTLYLQGWFSLVLIVFSDIAVLILTLVIDNYGNKAAGFSLLAVGNITSSALNLLGKLLEACDAMQQQWLVNRMVSNVFKLEGLDVDGRNVFFQLNDHQIIAYPMSRRWSVFVLNTDNEQCIQCIESRTEVKWVAKFDESHILIGLWERNYIAKFNVDGTPTKVDSYRIPGCNWTSDSDDELLEDVEMFEPPDDYVPFDDPDHFIEMFEQLDDDVPFVDPDHFMAPIMASIMATFPGKEPAWWMDFARQLHENVGRLEWVAKYDDNFLIGVNTGAQVLIWNKDNPRQDYASCDIENDPEWGRFQPLACLEVNGTRRIVMHDFRRHIRCVWEVIGMDLAKHTLELR